ncbi:MAG: ABC transporter permease [Gemmatimonadota bacterium]|nr:ABC transporter permease [Gemmatimonadota bacterium]MDP7032322.1 ABC transporter permease [Gemmatimonadota bacterium]
MRTLTAILRRDFRRRRRAPLGTLLMLAFPLALGAVFALAFGGSEPPRLRVALDIRDEGLFGMFLGGAVERPEFTDRVEVTLADSTTGRELLDRNEVSALVVIPADFTRAILGERSVEIPVWKNPRERVLPGVAVEGARILATGADAATLLLAEPLRHLRDLLDESETPPDTRIATLAVLFHHAIDRVARVLLPPVAGLATTTDSEAASPSSGSLFLLFLPGFAVVALLMVMDQSMRDFPREFVGGTLARCLAAPVRPGAIITGKILSTTILGVVCAAILTPFGAVFVDEPVDLPAFALLTIAFCGAAGGLGALVYGGAKSERQGAIVGPIVLLVMSFLGGSYVPLSALPPSMRALSPFTLNFWAVDGYGRILRDGAGVAGVAAHIGVLLALAIVLTTAGGLLLRRRFAGGHR